MAICRPADTFQNLDRTYFLNIYCINQTSQISRRRLQIVGPRMVTRSKVHIEDPKMLDTTLKIESFQ